MLSDETQAHFDLEGDLAQRFVLGASLACGVVVATFWLSVVGLSLVKKGVPETVNTFLASADRTYQRYFEGRLSTLLLHPEDLGFALGERITILQAAVGRYVDEDYLTSIEVEGVNLDRVREVAIGSQGLAQESYKYEDGIGLLTVVLRAEPTELANELSIQDASGARASITIQWTEDLGSGRVGGLARNRDNRSVSPVTPTTARHASEAARQMERKREALEVLRTAGVELGTLLERELLEEELRRGSRSLLLKLVSAVLKAPGLDESARRRALSGLLATELFQMHFARLEEWQIAALLDDSNTMDRVVTILWDPGGPGPYLRTARATGATAAATSSTATGGETAGDAPETIVLEPDDYRRIFKSEEPFRACLANQERLRQALEVARERGETVEELDVYGLVRSGHLESVPLCPSSGSYEAGAEAGRLFVRCSSHGSVEQPAKSHRQFAQLFAGFERARQRIRQEGYSREVVKLLDEEHRRQPGNPYIALHLGRGYLENRQYKKAHQLLQPLSDRSRENVTYSYHGGYAFYADGNEVQAGGLLERAAESRWDESEEDVGSRFEFYRLQDKARWALRAVTGKPVLYSNDMVEEDRAAVAAMRFLEFSQLSEPEYPSEVCQRGVSALDRALDPLVEAFWQPAVRDRLSELYERLARQPSSRQREALDEHLRALSKEFMALGGREQPICPYKGFYLIERDAAGRWVVQCTVHPDIDADATVSLDKDIFPWQVHALNVLIGHLVRRKNTELDSCLTNQDRIAVARANWDDPRRKPALSDLVNRKLLAQKAARCPARDRSYRMDLQGNVSCPDHYRLPELERRLEDWPLPEGAGKP